MFEWKSLLEKLSQIDIAEAETELLEEIKASQWLGLAGASEEQIQVAETRLGKILPPSYREFLKVSNGWRSLKYMSHGLYPIEKVDWADKLSQEWVIGWQFALAAYMLEIDEAVTYTKEPVYWTVHYVGDALQLSILDDVLILLNPEVITSGGEWEAWLIVNWIPGEYRFPSFWALMQGYIDNRELYQTDRDQTFNRKK